MKKTLAIFLFFVVVFSAHAQLTNKVMVSPDYRAEGSNAIVVKWVAEKVMYKGGFNVYRQAAPAGEWQKLNKSAIVPITPMPAALENQPQDYIQSYNMVTRATEADLHNAGLIRAFITLDILRSRELGEALGLVWYDETTTPGQAYRYKVEAITSNGSVSLGESKSVTAGPFVSLAVPDGIKVERSGERVSIVWAIDEANSIATLVEKSVGDGPFLPMSEMPYYISKNTNANGEAEYADVFIVDTALVYGQNYRYRLAAIDLFGQKGTYSEEFYAGMKGATMPLPPTTPEMTVNDANREITLTWSHKNVKELRGYVVLYRMDMADAPTLFVADTLPASSTSHRFNANAEGNYLVTIGAVDAWGNMAESELMVAKIDDVTPPAAPTGLTASLQEGIITISWQAPADKDALRYQVYRISAKDDAPDVEAFIPLGNEPNTSTTYSDAVGSTLAGKVFYAVSAIDNNFNKSNRSNPVGVLMPDIEGPTVPFIKNISALDKTLIVNFMPNVDDDLAFFLLKKTDAEGKTTEIQVAANAIQYEDKEISSGATYLYSLAAQDRSGNLSAYCNAMEAIAPGSDERILTAIMPTAISVKLAKSSGKVQLSWTQKFTDDNLGVVIFRGTEKDNLLPLSELRRTPEYEDDAVLPGNTYYYQVRTYASNGQQHQSEINEINIKAK